MLIKISTGLPVKALSDHETPNFVLFDHAEEVEYGSATVFTDTQSLIQFSGFTSQHAEVIRYLNPHVEHDLFQNPRQDGYSITEEHRYLANAITFTRKGKRIRVVFDGVAYICTDEGKTLEKVYAGGGYHQPSAA